MKKCIEGSHAVAQIIKLCKPEVVSAYPITPQTHIVEDLALMNANGEFDFEFIRADSEFAAASIVLGSSAMGGRSYTATSSQGLMLMTEVVFSIAGMRKPVVMTCANRAISSPINIWNDQQDSMTVRDSGWIMLYAQDNQEAMDLHLFAFKLAEQLQLPAMVNMDGFILTHTYETVDLPSQEQVDEFLPSYIAPEGTTLDTKKPVTLGSFATPDDYHDIRMELDSDLRKAKALFKKEARLFKKIFKRDYKLVEYYGSENPDTVFVSFGSLIGTIKDTVDSLIAQKKKVGVCNIICYRPFPDEEVVKVLSKVKNIIVMEKDVSLGSGGALYGDLKRALYGNSKAKIFGNVVGLGGRDIRVEDIQKIYKKIKK